MGRTKVTTYEAAGTRGRDRYLASTLSRFDVVAGIQRIEREAKFAHRNLAPPTSRKMGATKLRTHGGEALHGMRQQLQDFVLDMAVTGDHGRVDEVVQDEERDDGRQVVNIQVGVPRE